MRGAHTTNMTEGRPLRLLALFALPLLIGNLFQQPFGSMSMALSTYTSQNYGAGRTKRIREGFIDSMMATAALSVGMFLLMQLLGNRLIGLFVNEEAVIEMGGAVLKITSCFYIFLGTIYACRGVLNGVGDALFAFINGIVEIGGRIGLPMLLVLIPGVGVWAIWYTAGITWGLAGLSCILRYFSWKRKLDRQDGKRAGSVKTATGQ